MVRKFTSASAGYLEITFQQTLPRGILSEEFEGVCVLTMEQDISAFTFKSIASGPGTSEKCITPESTYMILNWEDMYPQADMVQDNLLPFIHTSVLVQVTLALEHQNSPGSIADPDAQQAQRGSGAEDVDLEPPDALNADAARPCAESMPGDKLGGQQDRGYRDGHKKAIACPIGVPAASGVKSNKRESCPGKAARSRAQRCLEDSSDDCSGDTSPHKQQQVANSGSHEDAYVKLLSTSGCMSWMSQ